MLAGYDKEFVGKTLKEIRKSLNLTQKNVCDITTLSSETLRRIENGMNLPSIRTITDLSSVYKINLLKVFSNIQQVNSFYNFYEYLDDLIVHYKRDKFEALKENFEKLSHQSLEMVNPGELKQFSLLIESLPLCYGSNIDFEASNELLIQAIKLTIPEFELNNYQNFKYSVIELRILFIIAVNLSDLESYDLANDIFNFVINNQVHEYASYFSNEFLKIKLKAYTNLAYNAHYLEDHHAAMRYSDLGIELALEHDLIYLLHFAYYRKGIAMYHLNPDDLSYIDQLNRSNTLLEIQGMTELQNIVKERTLIEYGIEM